MEAVIDLKWYKTTLTVDGNELHDVMLNDRATWQPLAKKTERLLKPHKWKMNVTLSTRRTVPHGEKKPWDR